MSDLTEFYDKSVLESISIDLYSLERTGSWDDRENMVCVVSAPEEIARGVRRAYRGIEQSGLDDFEMVETDAETRGGSQVFELYFGSSYGAGRLLGGVGELLYNCGDFGVEFENQF